MTAAKAHGRRYLQLPWTCAQAVAAALRCALVTILRTYHAMRTNADQATAVALDRLVAMRDRLVQVVPSVLAEVDYPEVGVQVRRTGRYDTDGEVVHSMGPSCLRRLRRVQALGVLADLARVFSAKAGQAYLEGLKGGGHDGNDGRRGSKGKRGLSPADLVEQATLVITTEHFAAGLAFVADVIQSDVPDALKKGAARRHRSPRRVRLRLNDRLGASWINHSPEASVALANMVALGKSIDERHLTDLAVLTCFQGALHEMAIGGAIRAQLDRCFFPRWKPGGAPPVPAVEQAMTEIIEQLSSVMPTSAPLTVMLPAMENVCTPCLLAPRSSEVRRG